MPTASSNRSSGTTRSSSSPKGLAPSTSPRPQARPDKVERRGDGPDRGSNQKPVNTKPLNFDITCTGLKPNTKHDFYYQNKDMTSDCRSLMTDANVGTANLVSDSKGKLSFKFQLTVKTGTASVRVGRDDYKQYTTLEESAGSKVFELRGQKSSAKSLVEFKDF